MKTSHLWLSTSRSLILCTLSSCGLCVSSHLCKGKLLWWRLSKTLMSMYSSHDALSEQLYLVFFPRSVASLFSNSCHLSSVRHGFHLMEWVSNSVRYCLVNLCVTIAPNFEFSWVWNELYVHVSQFLKLFPSFFWFSFCLFLIYPCFLDWLVCILR